MTKCTYPKCTLCIDNCTMDSIDFSRLPPVVHNNCEGCDLCWCICPEGAIDIPNIIEAHASGPMAAAMAARTLPFRDKLDRAIASGRFRPLLSLVNDIGWDNQVYKNTNAPRVVLHEENYPYQVNKG
jgi:Fe-S-cluster-containing hydrogenase component 2